MNWQFYFEIIKDSITTLATVTIAIVAILGLTTTTWGEKLKSRNEYDLARRLLRATLQLRNAISYVRNPWIPLSETQNALKETGSDPENSTRAVYQNRWSKITNALSDLDAESLEAEVLWGKRSKDVQESLRGCVAKLNISLWRYFNDEALRGEDLVKIRNIIYENRGSNPPDEFAREINNAVSEIEKYLKPYLKV